MRKLIVSIHSSFNGIVTGHAEMGFEPGWGACAGQLKALCERATAEV